MILWQPSEIIKSKETANKKNIYVQATVPQS